METKVCKKCGRELPISEFYIHKEMGDGHLNFCKGCVRARVSKHREENIEKIREYDRNRPNAKERGKKQRFKIKQDEQKYKKYKECKQIWASNNREKRNAENKITKALKKEKILRATACENCGKMNCKIEGHHYDYSKPLDVIWLCTECHGKVHKKYNKLELNIEQIKIDREND